LTGDAAGGRILRLVNEQSRNDDEWEAEICRKN